MTVCDQMTVLTSEFGASQEGHRFLSGRGIRLRVSVVTLVAVLISSACTSKAYMDIPLKHGAVAPDLLDLAARASQGDKKAQLDLGIRFEEGIGVPQDLPKAIKLYRLAASSRRRQVWVYSPPVGNETRGRVISIGNGAGELGLAAARERLTRLSP